MKCILLTDIAGADVSLHKLTSVLLLSSPLLPRRRAKRKPVPDKPKAGGYPNVRSVKTGLEFMMERRNIGDKRNRKRQPPPSRRRKRLPRRSSTSVQPRTRERPEVREQPNVSAPQPSKPAPQSLDNTFMMANSVPAKSYHGESQMDGNQHQVKLPTRTFLPNLYDEHV